MLQDILKKKIGIFIWLFLEYENITSIIITTSQFWCGGKDFNMASEQRPPRFNSHQVHI